MLRKLGNIVCPDEKGTEIIMHIEAAFRDAEETLCAPMRRGLKFRHILFRHCLVGGETLCAPMRRGLKWNPIGVFDNHAQRKHCVPR